jgi:hypothetical protein
MAKKKEKPLTRKDVLRLIKKHGGPGSLNLSGRTFEAGIDLRGLNLELIILTKAKFAVRFIRGTNITPTDVGAQLQRAKLGRANLEGVSLRFASLQEADLSNTNLKGAYLSDAHLEGVRLYRAQFDNTTNFQGVSWGDYKIGEELDGKFDLAVDAYRRLKVWYTQSGYSNIAAKFYYREKEANRKAAKLFSKSWNHRIALQLSYWVFGHGEGWKRLLFWIAGFVLLFALLYYVIGTLTPNTFLNSFYYSAVSFVALGYGSWVKEAAGWAKGLGVFETFLGFFMMTLLLVTFVRKWTR